MHDEGTEDLRAVNAAAHATQRERLLAFAAPLRFTWPYLALLPLALLDNPPQALANALLLLAALALLVTPVVAALRDGRWRTVPYLLAVFVAMVAVHLLLMSTHASWRSDDGLGRGFYLLFAQILVAGYLVAAPVIFAVTKGLARLTRSARSAGER